MKESRSGKEDENDKAEAGTGRHGLLTVGISLGGNQPNGEEVCGTQENQVFVIFFFTPVLPREVSRRAKCGDTDDEGQETFVKYGLKGHYFHGSVESHEAYGHGGEDEISEITECIYL